MENDLVRIAQLERRVAYLFHHLGLDPAHAEMMPLPAEFDLALRTGNMMAAIKIYREARGVSLKEAKEAVEARVQHRG
jgi:ribosomal protein L7/L12